MLVAPHPEPDTDITLPYYHDNGKPVWANIPVKLSSTHHTTTVLRGEESKTKSKILTPEQSQDFLPSRPQFISKQ